MSDPAPTRYHWPALDGLRGIAVLAVMAFHGWSVVSPNGYAGVDVYFALSGFLIRALLLLEREDTGRVHFGAFYLRRFLRLYPALLACVSGVVVLAVVADGPTQAYSAAAAAVLYVAHLWIYSGHDAWLLEHTWTPSLEEHYYLVWPVLLVGALRLRRSWRPFVPAVLVLTAVVAGMTLLLPTGALHAYVRGVPMLVGSAAAILWFTRLRETRVHGALSASLTALLLVSLVAMLFWPTVLPSSVMSGWTSLPGLLSTLIVVAFVLDADSTAARALGARWLRWTGRRAYGLYLYHFPILSLFQHHLPIDLPRAGTALGGVVVTVVVAAISYRYLELPFLRLKNRYRPRPAKLREGALS